MRGRGRCLPLDVLPGLSPLISARLDTTCDNPSPAGFATSASPCLLPSAAPGTGKTLLARACAKSTDAVFLKLAGPSLVQMFIGDGAKMVRDAFDLARDKCKDRCVAWPAAAAVKQRAVRGATARAERIGGRPCEIRIVHRACSVHPCLTLQQPRCAAV